MKQSEFAAASDDEKSEGRDDNTVNDDEMPYQLQILTRLPGISPDLASDLMAQFGSLKAIFSASQNGLRSVNGIGPKKASKLRKSFETQLKSSQ